MTAPALEWTSASVIEWLGTLGISATGSELELPVFSGPYIPEMPHLLAVVTTISGAGESMDGVGDIPGFQLLIRGRQNDPISAEYAARRADTLIRFAPFPVDVAGFRLVRALRSGGAPAVLGGEDDGDSTILVCNYLTEIIR